MPPAPRRFSVNFVAGQGPGADIAFHFNPRFDGWDKVVFNSQQGGQWGSEEKKRSMPFRKGTPFELVFMVLPEHYKVGISGPGLPPSPSSSHPFLPSLSSLSSPLLPSPSLFPSSLHSLLSPPPLSFPPFLLSFFSSPSLLPSYRAFPFSFFPAY